MKTAQAFPFRLRPFRFPDDVAALLGLLEETEAVDQSGEDISAETIEAQLTMPPHDPALDRCVVEHPTQPGQIIGQSALWTMPASSSVLVSEMLLLVHPHWRRQHIGSALLEQALRRAHALKADYVNTYVDTQLAASTSFLVYHHFQATAAYTEMRAQHRPRQIHMPAGFHMKPYAHIQHLPTLVEAFNNSYQGLWGHHELSADSLQAWLPELDTTRLFILFDPNQVVAGICRAEYHQQRSAKNGQATGYIDAPGLVPSYRQASLYEALLIHTINSFGEEIQLLELESWGDSPETIALYQDLGFVLLRQQHAYQRFVGMQDDDQS